MRNMYRLIIWMILSSTIIGFPLDSFNISLTISNIGKTLNNQSVFIAVNLPIDDELYIVDFHPIYDRQKVRFITTYLCSKAYSTKETFWFGNQPCHDINLSMIIYEWYYNIPPVQWPKDAGFRVGKDTPYRYIVIHVQYFPSVINNTYGQQIIMTHTKPKYKIGSYKITTNSLSIEQNRIDFSCRYHSPSIQIFSTYLYTNNEIGRTISLYRIRNNQLQMIIKGNLHWSKTFYQIQKSIDIQNNDYLIGACVYENQIVNGMCQILIMFWMNQNDDLLKETCLNNESPRIVERFLPNDANIPPQTLFEINSHYPKLSPYEWPMNIISNNKTNVLSLTYTQEFHRLKQIFLMIHSHKLLLIIFIWVLILTIALIIICILIYRLIRKKHLNKRSKKIIVGGETSSLSGWLTKRRFQQYDHDDHYHHGENRPLHRKHQWMSSSEESDLSDNEVFNKTDFRNVMLRN